MFSDGGNVLIPHTPPFYTKLFNVFHFWHQIQRAWGSGNYGRSLDPLHEFHLAPQSYFISIIINQIFSDHVLIKNTFEIFRTNVGTRRCQWYEGWGRGLMSGPGDHNTQQLPCLSHSYSYSHLCCFRARKRQHSHLKDKLCHTCPEYLSLFSLFRWN